MLVQVRFFASLAEVAGCSLEPVELGPAADVNALWAALIERHPGLGRIGYRPLCACDLAYADWGQRLEGVKEVAFLPPVSGG